MTDCTVVKEHMSQYIDNEMDDTLSRDAFEAHIASCETCREALASLQTLVANLGDLPELALPQSFHEEAMQRIRALPAAATRSGSKTRSLPTRKWFSAFASAAAGVLAVVLGLGGLSALFNTGGLLNSYETAPFADSSKVVSATYGDDDITSAEQKYHGHLYVATDIANDRESAAGRTAPQSIEAAATSVVPPASVYTALLNAQENKTVQQYTLVVTTEDFDAALAFIKDFTGTTLESSLDTYRYGNEQTSGTYRRSYIEKIIPAEQFDAAMAAFSTLGTVEKEDHSQYTVAYDIADLSARLNAKQDECDRLMALLTQTTTVEDMLHVDARLQTVINEMESYRSALTGHAGNISNPVFTIHLTEKVPERVQGIPKTFGTSMANAFIGSLNGTATFLESTLVLFCGILLPLLLIGLVAGSAVIIKRNLNRKKG